MAITPDPATTEWVPLWDLNGPSSTPGAHHVTHELGGTDVIQNNAWLNTPNIFTAVQTISQIQPELRLITTDQPVDGKIWRIFGDGGYLYLQSVNDAITIQQGVVVIDRTGVLTANAGLGNTPLNASQLTSGTVPDVRLSSNVALKNIDNNFVAQTFASYSRIKGVNALLYFHETTAPPDNQVWRMVGYGDGLFRLEALNDALSGIQASFAFYRNGGFSGLIDASQIISGTIPLARLPPLIDQVIGEWLPILGGEGGESGQTYRIQQGRYMRTGKLVHLWGYTQYNGPGGGGIVGAKGTIHGKIVIKNFPFPIGVAPGIGIHPNPLIAGSVAYHTNMYTPQDRTTVLCYGVPGQSYAYILRDVKDGGNPLFLLGDTSPNTGSYDVNDDTQLILAISYYID